MLQHFPTNPTFNVAGPPPVLVIGGYKVQEQGPLATLAPYLDVGARRVLPGHLLRRSRVLGTLHMGSTGFQQRISLTARTGEESIFTWHLRKKTEMESGLLVSENEEENEDLIEFNERNNLISSADLSSSKWIIQKIERDSSGDIPLPTTLQPKSAPEAVVKAQLAALKRGDVFDASSMSNWEATDPFNASRRRGGRRRFTMGIHYERLREMLAEVPYGVLMKHESAVLGPSAIPTQGTMLQEVWVKAGNNDVIEGITNTNTNISGGGKVGVHDGWTRFIWKLALQSENGCWVCTGIVPCLEDSSTRSSTDE